MTLLIWLGKSERPAAMMASGRTFLASSGRISGSGFAIAKMMGASAMSTNISSVRTPGADTPIKTSAPTRASFKVLLPFVHAGSTSLVNDTFGVTGDHIGKRDSIFDHELQASNASGTCSIQHNFDVFNLSLGYVTRVDQSSQTHDSSSMLIIVEHWDIHDLLQLVLDVEAVRAFDIFQVDTTEGGSQALDASDK